MQTQTRKDVHVGTPWRNLGLQGRRERRSAAAEDNHGAGLAKKKAPPRRKDERETEREGKEGNERERKTDKTSVPSLIPFSRREKEKKERGSFREKELPRKKGKEQFLSVVYRVLFFYLRTASYPVDSALVSDDAEVEPRVFLFSLHTLRDTKTRKKEREAASKMETLQERRRSTTPRNSQTCICVSTAYSYRPTQRRLHMKRGVANIQTDRERGRERERKTASIQTKTGRREKKATTKTYVSVYLSLSLGRSTSCLSGGVSVVW